MVDQGLGREELDQGGLTPGKPRVVGALRICRVSACRPEAGQV